ncbi:CvpA family protein [Asaia spathodeae]|uniref:CvpA family protein n=1 Tax=Asaia spathodeae TaxID=657016 RepID=A0ABX2P6J0_9PROT|nr:CvpA family protein [Asaia spathodeae]GBR19531.1 bacteriocin/colicin V production protein [Asaia spathodeae NBRC 105894]
MDNTTDIVCLVILGLSALWGFTRGFAREIFSLAAWGGAFVLAGQIAPLILPWLSEKISDGMAAGALAYVISFIVLVLVLSTIAQRFATGLRSVLVGGTDRLLGCGFGLVRAALILVVLYLGVVSFAGEITARSLVAGTRSGPYILSGVKVLQELTPYFPQLHLALPSAKGHDAAF